MANIVAVYGSLRQGCHNQRMMEGAKFLGTCRTKKTFVMLDLGSFPGVLNRRTPGKKIVVELYEVSDQHLARLDQFEGVPHLYDRIQVETDLGPAEMYVYQLTPVEARERIGRGMVVRSGDWLDRVSQIYRERGRWEARRYLSGC